MYHTHNKQRGFTLIELIVSLGLFAVVVTTAVGALLILVSTNNQLQDEQAIMSNLSFALDSMVREIRTGTNYYCDSRSNQSGFGNIFSDSTDLDTVLGNGVSGSKQNCESGRAAAPFGNYHGLAFSEGGDSITGASGDRILYYFNGDTSDGDNHGRMYRKVGDQAAIPITSSGLYIHDMDFYVTSAEAQTDGDDYQPTVTLYIQASESASATDPEDMYHVQTTVTQRILDL